MLGCDSCSELVTIASSRGGEVGVADCLHLPYRSGVFDSVISIAVIHHLSTVERRLHAIQELCRITRSGGSILVYVWAFEQERKKVTSDNSCPSFMLTYQFDDQDVMVPWHLQPKYQDVMKSKESDTGVNSSVKEDQLHQLGYRTYQRYYHVFKKGELSKLFAMSGQPVTVSEDYYDHDNWCVIAVKE